ncbi:thioesterase II family protein [Micromonospora echinospora]|uniref:thioesterase II family protein n=1 Tax=Micromonospora echinospora TaxID=1877 RepID=UPI0037A72CDA
MLLQRWLPRPSARLRLLCLPPAGGSATLYRSWATRLPADVELYAVEPPGHGSRYHEPAVTSMAELAGQVATAAADLARRPLALFGHSMGALLALEVGRLLRDTTGRPPAALLVASIDAPEPSDAEPVDLTSLPDSYWRPRMVELGALDSRTTGDPALMEMALAMFRADLVVMSGYRPRRAEPLRCPVRVYAGVTDPTVSERGLARWRRECPTDFQLSRLPGGHMFFRDDPTLLLARLAADLDAGRLPAELGAGRPAPY